MPMYSSGKEEGGRETDSSKQVRNKSQLANRHASLLLLIDMHTFANTIFRNMAFECGVKSLTLSRKRALELVALLRKMTCNLRPPVCLRHPV